jgi:hypothetical protein
MALSLPETDAQLVRGQQRWRVRGKLFVWERPLRPSEIVALGGVAREGRILGARVEHLGAKEALLGDPSGVFFTTPHFDGYAAILVQLDLISVGDLEEIVTEAWLARAPPKLASAFLAQRS